MTSLHWYTRLLLCGQIGITLLAYRDVWCKQQEKTWQCQGILVYLWKTLKRSSFYYCQKLHDGSRIFFQFLGAASFKERQDNENGNTFSKMPYFVFRWSLENNPAGSETCKTVCQLTRHWISSMDSIDTVVYSWSLHIELTLEHFHVDAYSNINSHPRPQKTDAEFKPFHKNCTFQYKIPYLCIQRHYWQLCNDWQ